MKKDRQDMNNNEECKAIEDKQEDLSKINAKLEQFLKESLDDYSQLMGFILKTMGLHITESNGFTFYIANHFVCDPDEVPECIRKALHHGK